MTKKTNISLQTLPVLETPSDVPIPDPFDSLHGAQLITGTQYNSDVPKQLISHEIDIDDDAEQPVQITFQLLWSHKRVIAICIVISLGGFLFGWDTGTIGGILLLPSLLKTIGEEQTDGSYALDTVVHGLIVGSYHIGAIIAGFTLVRLSDFKGRRLPIMVATGIYIVGNLIQLLTSQSSKWYQFMIGRFISGVCIGTMGALCPVFLSETSPAAIRGSLTTLYILINTNGLLFGSIVIYALKSSLSTNASWIVCLIIPMVVAAVVFAGIFYAPESARYLISRNDIPGAQRTLQRIGERDIPTTISGIKSKLELESHAHELGYFEMFKVPKYRKRLFTGMMVMFLQQMSGIDYFFYFGTQLFYSVGLNDSYVTLIILCLVNWFTAWAVMFVIERFGRKICLLVGSASCFITLMLYALVGVTMVDLDAESSIANRTPGIIMISFTCLYIVCFGCTWAGCGNVVVTEMFPLQIRSKGMGVSIAFNWGANFLIAFCTPIVTAEIHYYFGLVFAGCMFVSFWFVLFFVPETKGITLEEIDGLYEKKQV